MAVIYRVERTKGYVVMSNYHLKDRKLTLKSKGLLSMMLSLPDEWNYSTRGLAAICKEGVDAIGAALKELEKAGYIIRHQLRDARGRIATTEYVIFEHPQNKEVSNTPQPNFPHTENPVMDNPDMGSPHTENHAQYSINKSSIQKENKKSSRMNPSIHQDVQGTGDGMDTMESYRKIIQDNIEYDFLLERYGDERINETVEIILEAVCSKREYLRVAGDEFPKEAVKGRLLKLDSAHIEYAFDCIDKNTNKVRNIKAYLLTTLYNAPVTMDSYYRAEVNHDLYGTKN